MCMQPDFLNTILKEPDGSSEYVKLLIYYRDRKLENCYLTTEEKFSHYYLYCTKDKRKA